MDLGQTWPKLDSVDVPIQDSKSWLKTQDLTERKPTKQTVRPRNRLGGDRHGSDAAHTLLLRPAAEAAAWRDDDLPASAPNPNPNPNP